MGKYTRSPLRTRCSFGLTGLRNLRADREADALTAEPGDTQADYILPTGKYWGQKIGHVPASWLLWCYENNKCSPEVKNYVEKHIEELKTKRAFNQ